MTSQHSVLTGPYVSEHMDHVEQMVMENGKRQALIADARATAWVLARASEEAMDCVINRGHKKDAVKFKQLLPHAQMGEIQKSLMWLARVEEAAMAKAGVVGRECILRSDEPDLSMLADRPRVIGHPSLEVPRELKEAAQIQSSVPWTLPSFMEPVLDAYRMSHLYTARTDAGKDERQLRKRYLRELSRVGFDIPYFIAKNKFDWRIGRAYWNNQALLGIGDDWFSKLFSWFHNLVVLPNVAEFCIAVSTQHGLDKAEYEDIHANLGRWISTGKKGSKKIKAAFAIKQALETGRTSYPYEVDATCQAVQGCSILMNDVESARLSNVLPNRRGDILCVYRKSCEAVKRMDPHMRKGCYTLDAMRPAMKRVAAGGIYMAGAESCSWILLGFKNDRAQYEPTLDRIKSCSLRMDLPKVLWNHPRFAPLMVRDDKGNALAPDPDKFEAIQAAAEETCEIWKDALMQTVPCVTELGERCFTVREKGAASDVAGYLGGNHGWSYRTRYGATVQPHPWAEIKGGASTEVQSNIAGLGNEKCSIKRIQFRAENDPMTSIEHGMEGESMISMVRRVFALGVSDVVYNHDAVYAHFPNISTCQREYTPAFRATARHYKGQVVNLLDRYGADPLPKGGCDVLEEMPDDQILLHH
jgi:hypothetical protein